MTFERASIAVLFLLAVCLGVSTVATREGQAAEGGSFDTAGERIGGLRLGMPENELPAGIPCKPRKGKEQFEAATGETVQLWKYPDCGLILKMSSERRGAKKSVASITLTSPSGLATREGIRIGSTEDEVVRAYGRFRDEDGGSQKGKTFVAGSIYDGLIFSFKDGKVVRIFLGAAAE